MDLENTERTDYLVILKEGVSSFTTNFQSEFKVHTFYRAIQLENETQIEILVNGEVFPKANFDLIFESGYDRVMRDFKLAKLVNENGKPVSKTQFKKLCDLHTYISSYRTKGKLFKGRFVTFKDRGIYTFQTDFRENQNDFFKATYRMFIDMINGDLYPIEQKLVQYGNCGMSLSYSDLRVRDTSKDLEFLF